MRLSRRSLLAVPVAAALPGAARAQPAMPDLRIGVLTDLSSVYSDYGGAGSIEAARMAIADAGLTQQVRLLSADHQNKPDVGVSLARNWFDNDGVDAIFDVPTSSVALAVNTVAGQSRKLVFFSTAIIDRINEQDCNGYGLMWTWDIYSVARSAVLLQIRKGVDSWFIINQDYAAGHALAAMAKEAILASGGKVAGQAVHPLGTTDFSAYLVQAQASGAKFVMFTSGGSDLINALKQVKEFGLERSGQQIGTMYTVITDVNAIGLDVMQGLNFVTAFYWDRDEQTRAFARRFFAVRNKMPTMFQAGVYSAVSQYLAAVRRTGSKQAETVRADLRDHPFEDMFARNARLLPNGRLIHDMLLGRVKTPAESHYPWDYYELQGVVPAAEAFRPIAQSACKVLF